MRIIFSLFFMFLFAAQAIGQTNAPLDATRYIFSADTDFPGGDIRSIFDTTQDACLRACRADQTCVGLTYNQSSRACFPKSKLQDSIPFGGALSAQKVDVAADVLSRAKARMDAMDFLTAQDLQSARDLATDLALRYPAGGQNSQDLSLAFSAAVTQRQISNARVWAGFLVALTDSADAWIQFSDLGLRLPDNVPSRDRRHAQQEAVAAAVNAVLRAPSDVAEANALAQLAEAFEANGRGRDMIPALRLAFDLTNRQDLSERLDTAINTYGFRVTDHQVDSDSAAPRICISFSEPLLDETVDYDIYLKSSARGMVTQANGSQLCVDGVQHGETYVLTFRQGLPAASGETLARDVEIRAYVRDRAPSVRFPGRAYVLPHLDGAALPIETVNLDTVEMRLRAVSDRNVLRALQEDLFGRPLSQYQDDLFAREIAQEIWTGTAEVQSQLNTTMTTRLPLDEMLDGRAPGIYALTARVPGADPYDDPGATQWFVHSDLGLTALQGNEGLHVAIRGLSDAQARAGVAVTLVSNANAVLGRSITDADGFAQFQAGTLRGQGAAAPALLLAETENDLAFLSLTGPAFDLSDRGVSGRTAPGPIDVFLATDRGAYRPGEAIGVTALMRDDVTKALEGLPLVAVLRRPDGAEYARSTAQQSAVGGHVFQMPLGHDVPRGTWRLDMMLGGDRPLASQTVLVEDFLPERLDLTLSLRNQPVQLGLTPVLTMQSDYLFGAPGADLAIEAELRLRPTRTLAAWPGYLFGRHDKTARSRVSIAQPARTDAQGRADVALTFPELDAQGLPLEASFVARVFEGSGRPVERTLIQAVQSTGSMIGLKPLFDGFVPNGANAGFEVVALGADGQTQEGTVTWTVNRVETRYHWYQQYGTWNWEPSTRRTRVATGDMSFSGAPTPLDADVSDWGEYELVVQAKNGGATTSHSFYVGWYGSGDSSQTPDRLQVGLDREAYNVGDTASLRVTSSLGGTALVSILASDVIHREIVQLDPGEARIPLTVTAEWGTGAYATVSLLRPLGGDDPTPARALGIAHARVLPGDKALDVTLSAVEVTDGQEGTVDVTVSVGDTGAERFVTLAAVDIGIQNLTAHDAPDPTAHYFGQRRLGVDLRDLYGRLIDGQSGALGRVRSGGDAGARLKMQAPPPTEAPMVFFSGLVPVGVDGTAVISVPKPAFNGTIRLDAIAWSDRAIGNASTQVVARDPVVMTASLPRFMAPGDRSRLLLEFVQTEPPKGPVPLTINASGVRIDKLPTTVTFAAAGTTRLELPMVAETIGDHKITVSLALPNGRQITKNLQLGVRLNDPEIALTRRFSLAPGETFQFDDAVLTGLRTGTGRASLSAGPLARLDMPGLVTQLDRYPYGCTEQLTSAALPLLYLGNVAPDIDVQARVNRAVSRILTRQTSAGSFGLWRAQSGQFWLDAYVTDFLVQARDAGYAVPELALKQAMNTLQNRINYAPDFEMGGEDIAYALLVLAREGRASIADLRYYADAKSEAFATPRAVAQIGAALAAYGDGLRADRMFGVAIAMLENQRETRARYVDFGSSVSDVAAVLHLGVSSGSAVIDAHKLSARLTPPRALNTQEAAQVLMAAHVLRGTQSSAGLAVDGMPAQGTVSLNLQSGGLSQLVVNTGIEATDITLTTIGVPEVPAPAGGTGYAVSRNYYAPDGTPVSEPVQAGDQLVVVLTVTPFADQTARLMIEDPLPAGLEIENPNLVQSGQIRNLDWLKPAPTEHAEFLSDRFRVAVDSRGTKPLSVAYKVRAISPGDFHHPAASVQDMYRPDQRAVTDTGRWLVMP